MARTFTAAAALALLTACTGMPEPLEGHWAWATPLARETERAAEAPESPRCKPFRMTRQVWEKSEHAYQGLEKARRNPATALLVFPAWGLMIPWQIFAQIAVLPLDLAANTTRSSCNHKAAEEAKPRKSRIPLPPQEKHPWDTYRREP